MGRASAQDKCVQEGPRAVAPDAVAPDAVALALEAGRAYAWSWDGARFACSGAHEILGRVPASVDDLSELVYEPDRALRQAALEEAIEGSGRWQCAFRSAGEDDRWIEERGSARRGAAGGPVALAAVAFDVTRRKREEATLADIFRRESRARQAAEVATATAEAAVRALAQSEAYLESTFSSMADGLVLFDRDGRIRRANPAALEMLGQQGEHAAPSADEWVARLDVRDVEGRPVPPEATPLAAALRGEAVRGVPLRIRAAGGAVLWATCGAAPIRAQDGELMGAVLSLGDVTRLRDLQEQREDLSRTIAHDLRTPLNVILAQAKMLGRRNEPPEGVRARADAIAKSAQQMAVMLSDLVESALLEAGKLRLDLAPVDVAAMVHDLRRRLAAPYGDRIRVESTPQLRPVVADPPRIERVVANLLTNALKYSRPGSAVTVRIADGVEELTIAVEDQGNGIAAHDLPRLFERWFRSSATERLEGMGLGLYTARMLVEAHGGRIEVTSEAGKGSIFRVRLPRRGI